MAQRFFGFESLLIMAIIVFFVGSFFVVVQGARHKTHVTAYMTYAEQMYRLVAAAAAGGYIENYDSSTPVCVGAYSVDVQCVQDKELNMALAKISDMPHVAPVSPYNQNLGVTAYTRSIGGSDYVEMRVGVSGDTDQTRKVCEDFGWGSDGSSYCYVHIKKSTR